MNQNYGYQQFNPMRSNQDQYNSGPNNNQSAQQYQSQAQNMQKPITFPDFDPTAAVTASFEKVVVPEHTFVVDSRQRDCKMYPDPSYYRIDLGTIYRNVTSIELRGSVIPRASYNVHSTNKYIDFSIGSGITEIVIKNGGSGYVTPTITIASPLPPGTTATATAATNSAGTITNITVNIAGSNYKAGMPPVIYVTGANGTGYGADLAAVVGIHYTAELRPGQYTIGGNPTPPSTISSGIIKEIQDAMNYAVIGSPYVPNSTGPFEVRLVNQYPELDATIGTPEYYNTNSALFNRIQITNVDSDPWELLFCSGPNRRFNASVLMGFIATDYSNPVTTLDVANADGTLISGGTSLRSSFDYDLLDDPKYVILAFWDGNESFERIESNDPSIDRKFGLMVFDANNSNVITDTAGSSFTSGTSSYLVGPVTKGPFWVQPGVLKPIRGFDFDQKKLEFGVPLGKLSSLFIKFTKFSGTSNAEQELYDFQGRNHTLIFSIKANDNKTGRKN